jgi:PAS domain S-box-containing protein
MPLPLENNTAPETSRSQTSGSAEKEVSALGRSATRVVLGYVVVATLWILVSDKLVESLVSDPQLRITISVLKGWLFVAVTASLLFFQLRWEVRGWLQERAARGKAEEALLRQNQRQRLLLDTLRLSLETENSEIDLSVALMKTLGPKIDSDVCFHFRLSRDQTCLEIIAGIGAPPQLSPQIRTLPLQSSFAGQAVTEKRTVVVSEKEFQSGERGGYGRMMGMRCAVVLPLVARDGRVLGTLSFGSRRKSEFPREEVELLEAVAVMVSLATERMRAMAAMRESESRYRLLAENTGDVIWVLDVMTLRFTYVSPSVERLCGFTPEEVLKQTLAEVLTPSSLALVQGSLPERLERFAAGDATVVTQTHEIEQWRRDGSIVQTEVVTTLLRMPGGLQILGVTRDISERRGMERQIRAQQALLRETTQLAQVGGWEFDPISGNGTWTEETARIHDLDPGVQPDVKTGLSFYTSRSLPLIEAAVKEAVEKGTPYDLELEIETALGRNKWVRTTAHPMMENGRVVRVRGTIQDITVRKRAEIFTAGQKQVLEMIVSGQPLSDTLNALVSLAEEQSDDVVCSVMLTDAARKRLVECYGPGLPEAYRGAICGIEVGPKAGSCGTAVYRGEPVFVEDVETDPLWEDYRHLAHQHGLRSCWSIPIFGDQHEVLGTFAAYFGVPKKVDPHIVRALELSTHTASVAINRARIEAALRASEAQFRAVVESASDGIFIQTKRKFAYLNPAAARLLGAASPEQLVGREVLDFIHPDTRQKAFERIQGLNEKAEAAPIFIHRFIRLDGGVVDVEVAGVPFEFHGDHGALVFARDVTERRRSEEKLRFHEAILRETGHIAKVGGWSFDIASGECFWSEEVARIHEMDTEAPVQVDLALQFYQGESRSRINDALEKAVRDGTPYDLELLLTTAKGNQKWVRTIGHPVLENGRVVRIRGSFQDVSEKKQSEAALRESEARFRQVVENIEEVFWVSDTEKHSIFYVSPAYEKIWGISPEHLILNPSSWLESVHEEDRDRVAAALPKQALGNYMEVYRIRRPDRTVRWIQERAFPVRDDISRVFRIVGTAADITEHRNLEAQFRQAQKMEAIGTLAGGIAHDFNNILGAITGYADLAKMETTELGVRSSLDEISKASKRAADLVRQILTFSRQQEHKRQPLQLWRIVDEAVRLLRAAIPSTIEFDVGLEKQAPTVLADPTQIHQVVMNLCTNAAHAMSGRAGLLTVRLEAFDADWEFAKSNPGSRVGTYARLTVSDTGKGMDQATLDRIYEPFFTTKAPGEGTGLGLSVVHGVVRNHDGVITVKSAVDRGTTFQLYFPAYQGTATVVEADVSRLPKGKGERILVVEDEAQLAQMTCVMLARLGYVPESVSNPHEALEKLQVSRRNFQLVLTDLTMPGMTGVDLANMLAAVCPEMPVVMMTGYFSRDKYDLIESAGIKEVLLKPIDYHVLADTLRRVLDKVETAAVAKQ